jgi:type VI secretion system protein ImpF
MASHKIEQTIQQGLLDRLIDLDVNTRSEAPLTRAESLRQFRSAVKRDLEWLLNSTRVPIEIPESCAEAEKSVLCYGLPDISTMTLQNPSDEQRLLRSLELAIETFEPRLARPKVTSKEQFKKSQQAVIFHVEAILLVEPAPERIAFDTVLEISKGAYSVKET